MEDTKPFWASKTFWGAILAGTAALASLLNIELPVEGLSEEIVGIIGAALALYGRFAAKKALTVA